MPASKPTTLPRWIATGQIAAPSTLKQDSGYAAGEQPPSQYENYHKNSYYNWLSYTNDFEENPHAWTAQNSFTNIDKAHLPINYSRLTWGLRERYIGPGMESNGSNFSVTPPTPPTNPGGWNCNGPGTFDLYAPLPMDENEYLSLLQVYWDTSSASTSTVTLEVIQTTDLFSLTATVIGQHQLAGLIGDAFLFVNASSTPIALPAPNVSSAVIRSMSNVLWLHFKTVMAGAGSARLGSIRYQTGRLAV